MKSKWKFKVESLKEQNEKRENILAFLKQYDTLDYESSIEC